MPIKNTIVYVDDDQDDRDILAQVFSDDKEYNLLPIPSGEVLFRLLPTVYQDTCLVILDINMPGESGVEVLKSLRKHPTYSSLAAVILTNGANSPESRELEEMGVAIEKKPDTTQEMGELKEKLLAYC